LGDHFCMASAYFQHNETTLAFGIGVNGSAAITITNQKWNIPEGRYEIKGAIDGDNLSSVIGNGDKKTVSWLFVLGENSINALSKGKVFRVIVGNSEYQYGLAGSSMMLSALIQCATQVSSDANPFHGQPPAAPVSTPSNPFKRT
jgi:hypothetical protein